MPYIAANDRPRLDKHLENLAEEIKAIAREHAARENGNQAAFAGLLNYSFTTLLLKVVPARRYWVIALVTGVLHNVIDEFYRRYASTYEDEQIEKNGDVYPP